MWNGRMCLGVMFLQERARVAVGTSNPYLSFDHSGIFTRSKAFRPKITRTFDHGTRHEELNQSYHEGEKYYETPSAWANIRRRKVYTKELSEEDSEDYAQLC